MPALQKSGMAFGIHEDIVEWLVSRGIGLGIIAHAMPGGEKGPAPIIGREEQFALVGEMRGASASGLPPAMATEAINAAAPPTANHFPKPPHRRPPIWKRRV